jgi:3-hexulose-6-phosphate synthase
MVEKSRGYNGQIMCDMSAPARNLAQRTAEVDELGVDYVAVHTGYLPEYDYDIETHRRWFTPKVRPLDLAKVAKRNLRHAGLALNTGINESNIREVLALEPAVIMVGRGILDGEDRVAAAERLKRYMPFEG